MYLEYNFQEVWASLNIVARIRFSMHEKWKDKWLDDSNDELVIFNSESEKFKTADLSALRWIQL